MEIEQDRKAKVPEPDGVSDKKPGTRWVAEQELRAVAEVSAQAGDATRVEQAVAAVDEGNKLEIPISKS